MSGILTFRHMRWLMIGFLVSLGALLLAAAGMARHIGLHRGRLRQKTFQGDHAVIDETGLEPGDLERRNLKPGPEGET